ncbi:MAG: hypothetical protein KJ574_02140, partial [Nanoarchaeota archaeon]|nr:hypothetical protein [Nanoarchaeota archaeon]
GTLINNGTGTLTNITQFNTTGYYNVTAVYPESQNYTASSRELFINITDTINPTVYLISPDNGNLSSTSNMTFRCNATNYNLSNITLYTNTSGSWAPNQSVNVTGTFNETEFNVTDIPDGNYKWNCLASDSSGNSAFAATNRTFTVSGTGDFSAPYLDNIFPARSATGVSRTTNISFDIIDDYAGVNVSSLLIFIEGINVTPNATITINNANNVSVLFNSSVFTFAYSQLVNVEVNVSDNLSKQLNDSYSFTIESAPQLGGGGGGGGGGIECESLWSCGNWSKCVNSVRMRSCIDLHDCYRPTDEPLTSEPCKCDTEWSCTDWGECIDDVQKRYCTAISICSDKPYWKPREERGCEANVSVIEIRQVMKGDELIFEKGEVSKDLIVYPEEEFILALTVASSGNVPLHNVIAELGLPSGLRVKEIYPESIDEMQPDTENTIRLTIISVSKEALKANLQLRIKAEESSDALLLTVRQEAPAAFELPLPKGLDYAWLLLLLLIPAILVGMRKEQILADEFATRHLAQYGIAGKRQVYVTPAAYDKYPGLEKFHVIKLKDKQKGQAATLREKYHIGPELSQLLAYAGKKHVTVLTPIEVPILLRKDFAHIRFFDPLRIKDIQKIRIKETISAKPDLAAQLEKDISALDKDISGVDEKYAQLTGVKKKVEMHKKLEEAGLLKGKESEELEKMIEPIDKKLAEIKNRLGEEISQKESAPSMSETKVEEDLKRIDADIKKIKKKKTRE